MTKGDQVRVASAPARPGGEPAIDGGGITVVADARIRSSSAETKPRLWYLALFVILLVPAAAIARNFTSHAGQSIWTPTLGIVFGVLFLYGLRSAPILIAALLALTASPLGHSGAAWPLVLEVVAAVITGYGFAAVTARKLRIRPSLRRLSDAVLLAVCIAGGTALAVIFALPLAEATGYLHYNNFGSAFAETFASSAASALATAPLVILGGWWLRERTGRSDRASTGTSRWLVPLAEYLAQAGAFTGLAILAFAQGGRTYYPMLIPIGWLALRRGIAGTSIGVAVATTAVTVAAHVESLSPGKVEYLEVFIAVLALCGLVLGAAQTERMDAQRDVVESKRALAESEAQLRVAYDRLKDQANRDPLTRLPLRSMFVDRLVQAQARAVRSGRHIAVLFLDLNGFKSINDEYDHSVGDRAIVVVADRIRGAVRPSDTPARPYTGGDEFLVLCEDLPSAEEAHAIAARIREAIAEPITIPDIGTFHVTASLGVCFAGPYDDPEAVVSQADRAMFSAKRSIA